MGVNGDTPFQGIGGAASRGATGIGDGPLDPHAAAATTNRSSANPPRRPRAGGAELTP
jgi:hypothetical protein